MVSEVFKRIKARIPSFKRRMARISLDIASQIYEYMKEQNMSQRELANKLGKSESEISKWLSGSHNFTIETVAKVEDVLNEDILLVPKYAKDDLGISFEIPKTVIINEIKSI